MVYGDAPIQIIIQNGPGNSGKDTIAKFVEDYFHDSGSTGVAYISTVDPVRFIVDHMLDRHPEGDRVHELEIAFRDNPEMLTRLRLVCKSLLEEYGVTKENWFYEKGGQQLRTDLYREVLVQAKATWISLDTFGPTNYVMQWAEYKREQLGVDRLIVFSPAREAEEIQKMEDRCLEEGFGMVAIHIDRPLSSMEQPRTTVDTGRTRELFAYHVYIENSGDIEDLRGMIELFCEECIVNPRFLEREGNWSLIFEPGQGIGQIPRYPPEDMELRTRTYNIED